MKLVAKVGGRSLTKVVFERLQLSLVQFGIHVFVESVDGRAESLFLAQHSVPRLPDLLVQPLEGWVHPLPTGLTLQSCSVCFLWPETTVWLACYYVLAERKTLTPSSVLFSVGTKQGCAVEPQIKNTLNKGHNALYKGHILRSILIYFNIQREY